MSLVDLSEILALAKKKRYGVGAFNVVDFEMIRSIVLAAEKCSSPVIVQYAEGDDSRIPLEDIGAYANYLIKKTCVPICLHLDHGKTLSTIGRAIRAGFTSVMIDASDLPYNENVRLTKKVCEFAHAANVSVEAEIGRMINSEHEEAGTKDDFEGSFTVPKVAKKFAEATAADAIAVSFGTIHGVYAEKPNLDFERLREISKYVKQPLVVHGGSGLSDSEYRKIVSLGISKINFYSEMSYQVTSQIVKELQAKKEKEQKFYLQDLAELELSLVNTAVSEKMFAFGSAGKA